MPPIPTVRSLGFSPDGKTLATASSDGIIKIWDFATRQELYELKGHFNEIHSIAFSHDGQMLASGSSDRTAKLWELKKDPAVVTARLDSTSIAFAPDGKSLAFGTLTQDDGGSYHPGIAWIDVATQESRATFPVTGGSSMIQYPAAFSPDGRSLATGSEDGVLELWDLASKKPVRELQGLNLGPKISSYLEDIAFAPDGTMVAAVNVNGHLVVWNTTSQARLFKMDGEVLNVEFSPTGGKLALGIKGGRVEIRELPSFRLLRTLEETLGHVSAMRFSPDGRVLALSTAMTFEPGEKVPARARARDAVRLWEVGSGKPLAVLRGHAQPVNSISFAPDGRTVVTGSADGTARLWSTATWTDLLTLKGDENVTVVTAEFSPDGQVLATTVIGHVLLWRASARGDAHTHPEQP